MTAAKIDRVNVSFLWTRTFDHFFQGPAMPNYPYRFFARISSYKSKYEDLKNLIIDEHGLSLPWRTKRANWFWKYYFNGRQPWDVSGNQAWEHLVPFRKSIPAKVGTPWLKREHNVSLEGFFYRHGIAVAITVRILDSESLSEMVQGALDSRRGRDYKVTWENGEEKEYSLTALANAILDRLCEQALGPNESKGTGFPAEPFSITTIIQAGAGYRDREVLQGDEVHRALETLANWNSSWPNADPPKLVDKRFRIKNELDNHCLYGDQQGRAVWFPKLFTPSPDGRKKYALGWYHRNLVLSSLQTASLGAFLKHTADVHRAGGRINNYQTDWCWNAMNVLRRMYSGKKENTYGTWSARGHIEQNSFLGAMDYLDRQL